MFEFCEGCSRKFVWLIRFGSLPCCSERCLRAYTARILTLGLRGIRHREARDRDYTLAAAQPALPRSL